MAARRASTQWLLPSKPDAPCTKTPSQTGSVDDALHVPVRDSTLPMLTVQLGVLSYVLAALLNCTVSDRNRAPRFTTPGSHPRSSSKLGMSMPGSGRPFGPQRKARVAKHAVMLQPPCPAARPNGLPLRRLQVRPGYGGDLEGGWGARCRLRRNLLGAPARGGGCVLLRGAA